LFLSHPSLSIRDYANFGDFRKVGSHHRVKLASVDAFLEAERRDMDAGMEGFSRLQDELGLLE